MVSCLHPQTINQSTLVPPSHPPPVSDLAASGEVERFTPSHKQLYLNMQFILPCSYQFTIYPPLLSYYARQVNTSVQCHFKPKYREPRNILHHHCGNGNTRGLGKHGTTSAEMQTAMVCSYLSWQVIVFSFVYL